MSPNNKHSKDEITPESHYFNRRNFLKTSIFAGTALATGLTYRHFSYKPSHDVNKSEFDFPRRNLDGDSSTSYYDITHYNNFYEFSTDKDRVADYAKDWNLPPWSLEVSGLVKNPLKLSLDELNQFSQEERVYRFRCVEGWSMVIPWMGFAMSELLQKAEPLAEARYVAFTSYFDPNEMPNASRAGLPFPYVEGLRLDEAQHPLTILATGLYGKPMPNQNGAPIRLVVPWKYGFKSIKSVAKIVVTDREPPTTWNQAAPHEYGFYSNVNPNVAHPRWSQAQERRIGENELRPTLLFNGYADQVAHLYNGMDLRKYF